MQLFLAINPPNSVKDSIAMQLEPLKKEYPYFRWVDKRNYHIALQFLGGENDQKRAEEKISDAVFETMQFRLFSSGADVFLKNSILAQIIFYRSKEIEELVQAVKEKFQIAGSTNYAPHLTFARYRIPAKQQSLLIKKKIQRFAIDFEFDVTQITLFNSVIESENPLYEIVAEIPLYKKTLG